MANFRKSVWMAFLTFLCLVSVLSAVGCRRDDPPADTAADTTLETVALPPETDGDTTPPETFSAETIDPDAVPITEAAEYLDSLLASEEEGESAPDAKTELDMTMDLHMAVGKREQDVSMPFKVTEISAGEDGRIISESMGEAYELVYVDGMLYVDYYGTCHMCPATPEQFRDTWDFLEGNTGGADDDTLNDLFRDMRAADIFATIDGYKLPNGHTMVVVTGLRQAAADKVAPELMEFFYSLGMVGGGLTEEEYESKTDDEIDELLIKETAELLRGMANDALRVTFTADGEDNPVAVSFRVSLGTSFASDGETVKVDLRVSGEATHTVGEQTITAPADTSRYEEGTWEDFFGTPTPEEVGLIPDEKGVYTLSDDPETRAEQTWCIYNEMDSFAGATFRVKGVVELLERPDDGSTVLTIYTRDASGAIDNNLQSSVDGMFAEGKEDKLIAAITSGNTYQLTGTFRHIKIDGYEYLVFVAETVTPAATQA